MKLSVATQECKCKKRLMRGQRSNKLNQDNKLTLRNDCKCSHDFYFYPIKDKTLKHNELF